MRRGSIKKFLVVTVAYVFTNIPLLFEQPQPLLFLKNGLQLLKKKALEMIPKSVNMEELKHKASLRVAERIIIFEIASHFN